MNGHREANKLLNRLHLSSSTLGAQETLLPTKTLGYVQQNRLVIFWSLPSKSVGVNTRLHRR